MAFAQAVAKAIESSGQLIAEAGTGTGKTFAYLAPAILAGGKLIVSTGTKTLQDQLFYRDLPTLRDALRVPLVTALLKGRANYVCHLHLERALKDGQFPEPQTGVQLKRIQQFAKRSDTGDKAECSDVSEISSAWRFATSTRENCLGNKCAHYDECFVMKARKKAIEAEVVVVNHHLFFADLVLREEGFADLLPSANTVVFDEAHHLPETAALFFGENFSTVSLIELGRDVRMAAAQHCNDVPAVMDAAFAVEYAGRDLRLAFPLDSAPAAKTPQSKTAPGQKPFGSNRRYADRELAQMPLLAKTFAETIEVINKLAEVLDSQKERHEELEKLWERSNEISERIEAFLKAEGDADDSQEEAADVSKKVPRVRWAEVTPQGASFNTTPLIVGPLFKERIAKEKRAWIFTSATLSVRGHFEHYQRDMGLDAAATATWESPFDYPNNGLLYVPPGMPDTNSPDYLEACINALYPAVKASKGRAFLLFTNLRTMEKAAKEIKLRLKNDGLDYPVLLQGELSKANLLDRFRQISNGILIGSQSFWEGVDVKGEQLSLVVIDRLPFAAPDDPLLAARIDYMQRSGGNPFMDYQLPRAVINLKQGAGRLIRDEHDRGVLMICDTRLVDKPYGKQIWRSLPPMKRTRAIADVEAFFANTAPSNTSA